MQKCLKLKANITKGRVTLNKKLRLLKKELSIIGRGIRLIPSYLSKDYLALKTIVLSLRNFAPYISIYMSGKIITLLSENADYNVIIKNVILAVVSILICDIISRTANRKCLITLNSCWYKHEALLSRKALSLDYAQAGSAEVSALRSQISENTRTNNTGVIWLADSFATIISELISLVIAIVMVSEMFFIKHVEITDKFAILINSKGVTFSVLIITFVLIGLTVYMNGKSTNKIFLANNVKSSTFPILDYYSEKVLNENETGKDIRIFNERKFILNELNRTVITPLKHARKKIYKSEMSFGVPSTIITSVMSGIIYIFVGLKALSGVFGVGKVVEYYGALTKLIQSISTIIMKLGYIKYNNLYLEQELDYLDLKSNMLSGNLTITALDLDNIEFEFHDVSFKYPNCNDYAIKNLSLKINAREHIALVGTNGSGKTTLINLLSRLYDPTEGIITLNGINIRNFKLEEYFKLFAVVFQDFKLLAFSIGENVSGSENHDEHIVWKCIEMVGLKEKVKSFPKQLKQPIYKLYEKDGIDISGGEEQKIAIARALYKDAPFIILDEPTASLDPISENEIYTKFNELVGKKSAIFISHRLSSCKFCDRIFVLNNGNLVEEGTHDFLIANQDGYYYKLWMAQADYYN